MIVIVSVDTAIMPLYNRWMKFQESREKDEYSRSKYYISMLDREKMLEQIFEILQCKSSTLNKQKGQTVDKKINKVLGKEKAAVKETKELLKMDKKQDKKMASCDMKMKKK